MHKDAAAFAENLDAHGEASLMSQVFDALYDDAEEVFMSKGGYVIPKREAALVEATGGSPTYGEITGEGVTQFLRRVPLRPDDVLVDLGSGLGRLVLQVACSARLRRCVGIELSASRHEEACWVAAQLAHLNDEHNGRDGHGTGPWITGPSTSDGEVARTFMLRPHGPGTAPESSLVAMAEEDWMFQGGSHGGGQRGGGLLLSPVELRCEDLMAADLADGSVFFLCSTAFSSAACRAIAERLYCHPRFRVLVTSRALPFPSPLTLGMPPVAHFPHRWHMAFTASSRATTVRVVRPSRARREQLSVTSMFTGIVQGTANVTAIDSKEKFSCLDIRFPHGKVDGIKTGASVAVNGTCLTVTRIDGDTLSFDIMMETLRATNLGGLKTGSVVNFERSARVGDEIGGHNVSGHVHCTATIAAVEQTENNRRLTFEVSNTGFMKYILPKGYIAVDGCSLTIGEVWDNKFTVYLIPETIRVTVFGVKGVGDSVNIEIETQTQAIVDTTERVVAQYLERLKGQQQL
ncbi:hypothetical protein VOLCADRAFT_120730 [Volvox carteri f. nagariensis]|uniref:Lumazine-binding domain-containing protein n=1 Tax=Volvox carteri f. nagariensis TaxID=3068 RepID=D8TS86_VOLCA|nr:uncharacterized protein VOLCADRAFT_120730 [Volvox carteri f. nagariensis]EFJ49649.1 hypothetical protein VOLCADRAFT_120730 [Volvox carteri f. nagariensis]|eukprot:XP_002949156.1 hypothetical protein VOLCADRAFT_120730 [Volvox carteri f. nagariensis]